MEQFTHLCQQAFVTPTWFQASFGRTEVKGASDSTEARPKMMKSEIQPHGEAATQQGHRGHSSLPVKHLGPLRHGGHLGHLCPVPPSSARMGTWLKLERAVPCP